MFVGLTGNTHTRETLAQMGFITELQAVIISTTTTSPRLSKNVQPDRLINSSVIERIVKNFRFT